MTRTLFVPDQNVVDLVLLEEFIINRKHCATRISENIGYPLINECLDDHLGTSHFTSLRWSAVTILLVCFHRSLPVYSAALGPSEGVCSN